MKALYIKYFGLTRLDLPTVEFLIEIKKIFGQKKIQNSKDKFGSE